MIAAALARSGLMSSWPVTVTAAVRTPETMARPRITAEIAAVATESWRRVGETAPVTVIHERVPMRGTIVCSVSKLAQHRTEDRASDDVAQLSVMVCECQAAA